MGEATETLIRTSGTLLLLQEPGLWLGKSETEERRFPPFSWKSSSFQRAALCQPISLALSASLRIQELRPQQKSQRPARRRISEADFHMQRL